MSRTVPVESNALITVEEAAAAMRVSTKTVHRLIRDGRLRAGKVGRNWRIRPEDLPCGGRRPEDVVYLDDNASNPLHPLVAEAVIGVIGGVAGNASSSHQVGQRSRAAVEAAREKIAELVGARPQEVVFTSGATEANNLGLRSLLRVTGGRLIVAAGDHPSVLRVADAVVRAGGQVEVVGLRPDGTLDLDGLAQCCSTGDVGLVAVGAANSETGVLHDIAKISEIVHSAGGVLFCDATQWVGRLPWDMDDLGVDAMSMSAHKMCGPQGVGGLVVRRSLLRRMEPITFGGGHELGLRPGTHNVAGIVGFGVAASLAARQEDTSHVRRLRDALETMFVATVNAVSVNGGSAARLPNTSNLRFPGAPGDAVLVRCPTVAASLGSACHSGAPEPSPTLLAMGLDPVAANESIRFSLTRFTTRAEIERAVNGIADAVGEVRRLEAVA